jgi:CRISPR-associated protein Csm5
MKATITTLSPVHIGNGNTYNKGIDFIQIGNKIGKVDEEKVLSLIGSENIGQWVSAIENFDPDKTYQNQILLDFFEKRGIRNVELEQICSQISEIKSATGKSTQLKEHFRTKLKGLCIPGSSLKGAIKTAIWDYFTSDRKNLEKLKSYNFKNNNGRWSDSFIDSLFFGKDANSKITRFLKVGDIHFEHIQTHIYESFVLNAYNKEWDFKPKQQILVESIPEDVSVSFVLKIDNVLLKRNINKDKEKGKWEEWKILPLDKGINKLTKIINEFTDSIVEYELANLKDQLFNEAGDSMIDKYESLRKKIKDLKENEFIIRVGANSGYLFTTGQWIDKEGVTLNKNEYDSLRKFIQKKEYDMSIWPKTRKITKEGQVFGFVKVSFNDQ